MLESAQRKKPFLCYLATNTPHGPFWPKEEDRKVIAEIIAQPKFDHLDGGLKKRLALYLGMIRNIDWNMGKLMQFLDDEELTDDTILIFKTDNGSLLGPQYFNAGMRGKKTEIWEGAPGSLLHPVAQRGLWQTRDVGGLTQVQDLLPTLLDLCEIRPKEKVIFDGMSLAPILRGKRRFPMIVF